MFKVAQLHDTGMFAVIDTRTGDIVHLYPDEKTANRVAARSNALDDYALKHSGERCPEVHTFRRKKRS
jgi:hypothetical protein